MNINQAFSDLASAHYDAVCQRFAAQIAWTDGSSCWNWNRELNDCGYGIFRSEGGRTDEH